MIDVPAGHLYLGEQIDATSRERDGTAVLLEASDLTTHGVIVGMTGLGKTGLGVVLLEEALLQGIPTLVFDPKGDLGTSCSRSPSCGPRTSPPGSRRATPPRWPSSGATASPAGTSPPSASAPCGPPPSSPSTRPAPRRACR